MVSTFANSAFNSSIFILLCQSGNVLPSAISRNGGDFNNFSAWAQYSPFFPSSRRWPKWLNLYFMNLFASLLRQFIAIFPSFHIRSTIPKIAVSQLYFPPSILYITAFGIGLYGIQLKNSHCFSISYSFVLYNAFTLFVGNCEASILALSLIKQLLNFSWAAFSRILSWSLSMNW